MLRYLLGRLPSAAATLALASVLVFALVRVVPGDAASVLAGEDADPATVAAVRAGLGLDRPAVVQYWAWLGDVLRGDLGTSFLTGRPVVDAVVGSAGATLELAVAAALLAVLLGLPTGLLAATTRRRPLRAALTAVLTLGVAVPAYVTGTVLVLVLAVGLRLLPVGGRASLADPSVELQYLVLPAVTLALPAATVLARHTRDAVAVSLGQDYVRTARAAGVGERRVLGLHALRPAAPVLVTVLGLQLGHLLGGAVVVEQVFGWPGLGRLSVDAVSDRDYPLVQALLLLAVTTYVALQLLTDVVASWVDPRIRLR